MINQKIHIFLLLFLAIGINSCGIYSFTGVNTLAKSITVNNFTSVVSNGPPNMALDLTERLKEYYQRNSQLSLADKDGDLILNGKITRFQVTPISATGTDVAAQNRLSIAVEVEYVNNIEEKKDFTQTFSFYSDFPQTQTLSQVEADKVDEIFEQIVLDIFTKTIADW
ncbi:MAG: LptE family protein [Microscillaceae bacterium]|nr:LptE family protein [Microscillaceae bacterium]